MEIRINMDEKGVEVLMQLSITLSSQLRKIEPVFGSICEIKKKLVQIKGDIERVRRCIISTTNKIKQLKGKREVLVTRNMNLESVTARMVGKSRARLIRSEHAAQEQVCEIHENVIE